MDLTTYRANGLISWNDRPPSVLGKGMGGEIVGVLR